MGTRGIYDENLMKYVLANQGGGGGEVTSVNGKKGAVVLTAVDVGAVAANGNYILAVNKELLGKIADGTSYNLTSIREYTEPTLTQIEVGSEHVHLNLNTIDNVTIETTSGKKVIATLDDIGQVELTHPTQVVTNWNDQFAMDPGLYWVNTNVLGPYRATLGLLNVTKAQNADGTFTIIQRLVGSNDLEQDIELYRTYSMSSDETVITKTQDWILESSSHFMQFEHDLRSESLFTAGQYVGTGTLVSPEGEINLEIAYVRVNEISRDFGDDGGRQSMRLMQDVTGYVRDDANTLYAVYYQRFITVEFDIYEETGRFINVEATYEDWIYESFEELISEIIIDGDPDIMSTWSSSFISGKLDVIGQSLSNKINKYFDGETEISPQYLYENMVKKESNTSQSINSSLIIKNGKQIFLEAANQNFYPIVNIDSNTIANIGDQALPLKLKHNGKTAGDNIKVSYVATDTTLKEDMLAYVNKDLTPINTNIDAKLEKSFAVFKVVSLENTKLSRGTPVFIYDGEDAEVKQVARSQANSETDYYVDGFILEDIEPLGTGTMAFRIPQLSYDTSDWTTFDSLFLGATGGVTNDNTGLNKYIRVGFVLKGESEDGNIYLDKNSSRDDFPYTYSDVATGKVIHISDLSLSGHKIRDMAAGVLPTDAVNMSQHASNVARIEANETIASAHAEEIEDLQEGVTVINQNLLSRYTNAQIDSKIGIVDTGYKAADAALTDRIDDIESRVDDTVSAYAYETFDELMEQVGNADGFWVNYPYGEPDTWGNNPIVPQYPVGDQDFVDKLRINDEFIIADPQIEVDFYWDGNHVRWYSYGTDLSGYDTSTVVDAKIATGVQEAKSYTDDEIENNTSTLLATLATHTNNNTIHVTALDKSAWNAKLDSTTYTATDVLAKIITVDGAGSALDADLLDGKHASEFATAAQGLKADSAIQSLPTATTTVAGIVKLGATGGAAIFEKTVNITGDQSIDGQKTFTTSPIVAPPLTTYQAANKGYVDQVKTLVETIDTRTAMITSTGDGTKTLLDDGTYGTIASGKIDTINGENPDENKNYDVKALKGAIEQVDDQGVSTYGDFLGYTLLSVEQLQDLIDNNLIEAGRIYLTPEE